MQKPALPVLHLEFDIYCFPNFQYSRRSTYLLKMAIAEG